MSVQCQVWRLAPWLLASVLSVLAGCGGGDGLAPPTLAVASSVAGAANGPITYKFTFSEDVGKTFGREDVVVSGGTKGSFNRLDPLTYSLVVTPPSDSVGTIVLTVAADAYANEALIPGGAPVSLTQLYDTQAPTLAMGSSAVGTIARASVTVTFTFSEDVGASFTSDSVQVVFSGDTGGTKGAFTRVSGSQANLVVTPSSGAAGTITVSVRLGAFSDLAGNANAVAYFGAQQYDTR